MLNYELLDLAGVNPRLVAVAAEMVGLGRLELPTFPIHRDALTSGSMYLRLFILLISRSRLAASLRVSKLSE